MLGTLIQGRVSVCGAAINASKVALAIAVRHAEARRQFGPPDGEEVTLMTYRTHQRRLLPHLADAYALHFAQERLVATLAERFGEEGERGRELETMAERWGTVSAYLNMRDLGLTNTLFAIILPGSINIYNLILMRNFFEGIPGSLFESAEMDGRAPIGIFFKKSITFIKGNAPASIGLMYAVYFWNDILTIRFILVM